jgi:NAD(P)-dependent dehydrogenase (short-subunit alcohol dehydrogenase family)
MTASTTKTVLVTNATGAQGRAVIDALLSTLTTPFHVLALTRDRHSAHAKDLALRYPKGLTLVEADLASPESVRKLFINEKTAMTGEPVWGIYLVAPCALASNTKEEERQGKVHHLPSCCSVFYPRRRISLIHRPPFFLGDIDDG